MLDGFGQAPVCLELDLDSYDGPWTHVERFRGCSGWLVVAEARVAGDDDEWTTTIVAACDDYGDPVPAFMAPNLVACACSLPEPCDEIPPGGLESLLGEAVRDLKLKWLRDSNVALAQLAERAADQIIAAESQTKRIVDEFDRRIADLQRRRRMLGMNDPARSVFQDAIITFELERDAATEQLAAQQQRMRRAVEEEEWALIRSTGVRVAVEPLYHVRWSAAARASEEMALARAQFARRSDFHPYCLPSREDGLRVVGLASAATDAQQDAGARHDHRPASNDLDIEFRAALARSAAARAPLGWPFAEALPAEEASQPVAAQPVRRDDAERLEKRAMVCVRQVVDERRIGPLKARRYRIKVAALRRDARAMSGDPEGDDAVAVHVEAALRHLAEVEEILARHEAPASASLSKPSAPPPPGEVIVAVPDVTLTPPAIEPAVSTAPATPSKDGKLRLVRAALAQQLADLEKQGQKFLNGSPKFKRNREMRDELAVRIRALDARIAGLQPGVSIGVSSTVPGPTDLLAELASHASPAQEQSHVRGG